MAEEKAESSAFVGLLFLDASSVLCSAGEGVGRARDGDVFPECRAAGEGFRGRRCGGLQQRPGGEETARAGQVSQSRTQ